MGTSFIDWSEPAELDHDEVTIGLQSVADRIGEAIELLLEARTELLDLRGNEHGAQIIERHIDVLTTARRILENGRDRIQREVGER